VLIIAAALSVQDPRERPMEKQDPADEAHRKFRDERSDFLSFLKLWDFYHGQSEHLSTSKLRKMCQANFLSFVRMREWHDVHQQLHALVGEMGLTHGSRGHSQSRPDPERRSAKPQAAGRGARRGKQRDRRPAR
jgi:ATP-dependent helicase HrpA